jgi:hypothetical protein
MYQEAPNQPWRKRSGMASSLEERWWMKWISKDSKPSTWIGVLKWLKVFKNSSYFLQSYSSRQYSTSSLNEECPISRSFHSTSAIPSSSRAYLSLTLTSSSKRSGTWILNGVMSDMIMGKVGKMCSRSSNANDFKKGVMSCEDKFSSSHWQLDVSIL